MILTLSKSFDSSFRWLKSLAQFTSESIKIQTHNANYKILAANCMNPINNKLVVQQENLLVMD